MWINPRRPPIWACACGCKRFRKVNPDGTDAAVKVKMLKNIRKRPLTIIEFTTAGVLEGRFGLRGVRCVEMTLKKE